MMNILLVEDEPLILRSLAGTIKSFQQNYQIVGSAYNGQEAIDLLSKKGNQIDVVITDIHIPVIDGLELIEHINQHFPHILCMILTGFSDFSYAKRAIQLRVFAYLLKPIDENEIQEHHKNVWRACRTPIPHRPSPRLRKTGEIRNTVWQFYAWVIFRFSPPLLTRYQRITATPLISTRCLNRIRTWCRIIGLSPESPSLKKT